MQQKTIQTEKEDTAEKYSRYSRRRHEKNSISLSSGGALFATKGKKNFDVYKKMVQDI